MSGKSREPNSLINESSPYLLQHAYNPVNWLPFGEQAFKKAKDENKLVLISIGYSACHWCHVMEKESFEDEETAVIMNENFVCIKVDREERSDVDMLYMTAVQLMTRHGGWPLNCFTLADGRPVYGGTYFNNKEWKNILTQLATVFEKEPERMREYAQSLEEGMKQTDLISTGKQDAGSVQREMLQECVKNWKKGFDPVDGGPNRAPKFSLPNNYSFLLNYGLLENEQEIVKHVDLTLQKMANGGINDQLRGGFARYSVDMQWKVPHFEKMLYDNAQLAELYTEAYAARGIELYKETAKSTLAFMKKEWMTQEGNFYSAFDADSEGEEGKYYVWQKEELRMILKDDLELFAELYGINEIGYWEDGNYILMRNEERAAIALSFGLSHQELMEKERSCKEKLLQATLEREKPGLDDKAITSWNALACRAFAKAYLVFGEEEYKVIALKSMDFMLTRMTTKEGGLLRTYKKGQAKVRGMLDDYAFVISALISCSVISADENYLKKADELMQFVLKEFDHADSHLFYYTDRSCELMMRSSETSDNVIPASNSEMALDLFLLSRYLNRSDYAERAQKMLETVLEEMKRYGPGYSNWAMLALKLCYPFYEVAIVGNNVDEIMKELGKQALTNTILATAQTQQQLPLVRERYVKEKTLIYVCRNNACRLPVETVKEALKQFENEVL